ncbi:hypothetical protein C2G38_2142823 [Gigaspora rosea]|uniref:Uncharacterized protein n=1 Tax=Gigaspora rosea TaxID=44941 RepID=A0A397VAJ5_9GLOM|nr:hypothetical protein C2G38_2142823 [Gigaspora rosea]
MSSFRYSIRKKCKGSGCSVSFSHSLLNKRQLDPTTTIIDTADIPLTTDTIPIITRVKDSSQPTSTITITTPTTASISHSNPFLDSIDKLEPFIYAFFMIIIITLFALYFRFYRKKNKSDNPENDVDIIPREVRKSLSPKRSPEKRSFEKSFKITINKVMLRSVDKALIRSTSGEDLLLGPPLTTTPPTPTTPTTVFEVERPPLTRTPTTVSSFTEIFESDN